MGDLAISFASLKLMVSTSVTISCMGKAVISQGQEINRVRKLEFWFQKGRLYFGGMGEGEGMLYCAV